TRERVGQLRDRMEETADRLRRTGQSSMDKIQSLVDDRIAKAVEKMSVPTREDIEDLAAKMNSLTRRVVGEFGGRNASTGAAPAAGKRAARKATTTKRATPK